jgi:sec-independent protein translocase protein TatC
LARAARGSAGRNGPRTGGCVLTPLSSLSSASRFKIDRAALFRNLSRVRKALFQSVIVTAVLSCTSFLFAKNLLLFLAAHTHTNLYYFTLSEVFFSTMEVAVYTGLFLSVPFIMFLIWRQFRESLSGKIRRGYLFAAFAVLLFYVGCVFCYLVVLPNCIGFLVSYQGGPLKAMLSTDKFVHFCITMEFACGISFELPVVMLLLGKLGIVTSKRLTKMLRYAVLLAVIAASIITPTPDVYNLSLVAVPIYVLFEVGLLLLKVGERSLTAKTKSV